MQFNQIRTRIVVYFVTISVLISLLFGALNYLFSYIIEDSMFLQLLNEEAALVEQQVAANQVPTPRLGFVQFVEHQSQLPPMVLKVLEEEPQRVEFSGLDGRHYHLKRFEHGFLLAEVSDYLVVRKLKGDMAWAQLIFVGIVAVIVALISWSLAKQLIRPIDQLNSVLNGVEGQELPVGFSSQFAHDEIGRFARELDKTMTRVNAFIQREQDFTRDVSHELRTPIAISHGALSLIKDTELNEKQRELTLRLQDAQDQMQQCIEGLLALAREQSFAQEQVRLLPLIETTIVAHHHLLERNEHDVELSLDVAADATITTSPQALTIILGNLIGNAFSHTHSGEISISYGERALVIRNPSTGIDSDLMPQIFESGIKGVESRGYGIGLSLVKRLCDRLNAYIDISGDNQSTVVTLKFLG